MAKRIATDAVLLAVALTIFVLEAQMPSIVPIPGIKLGLANIITVYAMFKMGPKDTLAITLGKVVLGSIFSGQMTVFFFSLAGSTLCFLSMLFIKKLLSQKQIWVCSVIGSVSHNIGQMAVAVVMFKTFSVTVYLPVLIISAIITGLFTGICAQLLANRIKGTKIR